MPDVIVTLDGGSLVGIRPWSTAGEEWMNEHLESESWQWIGNTLWVDHRMAEPVIEGMRADGLELQGEASA